jgi:TnsA endonuclease N terminal
MTHKKVTAVPIRDLDAANSALHPQHPKWLKTILGKPLSISVSKGIPAMACSRRLMARKPQNNLLPALNRVNQLLKSVFHMFKGMFLKGRINMRVRKVVTRSGKRFRGKFPSQKMNKMVHWESLLERDAIFHFEYHPQVVKYQEQPSIEYYYDKEAIPRKYYPDFLVTFADDSELLVEVKYVCDLASKKAQQKYQTIAKRLEEQDRRFRIMTEVDIRREPLLSNLKHIHRCGKRIAQAESQFHLAKTLSSGSRWTLANVVAQLKGLHNVLRLVRSNHLQVNLEAHLSDECEVFLTEIQGGHHGAFRI